jgi:hypothetical protein
VGKDWVLLSNECRGRYGIVTAPSFVTDALLLASRQLPPVPPGEKTTFKELLETCQKWGATKNELRFIQKCDCFFLPRPVYRGLTVGHIKIKNTNCDQLKFEDVIVNTTLKTAWRWQGYPLALSFYWAFLFHEQNEYLRDPQKIWERLTSLRQNNPWWSHFCLACFERTIGARYDVRTRQPHYLTNIVQQEGLLPAEQEERPQLFSQAIDFLLLAWRGELDRLLQS